MGKGSFTEGLRVKSENKRICRGASKIDFIWHAGRDEHEGHTLKNMDGSPSDQYPHHLDAMHKSPGLHLTSHPSLECTQNFSGQFRPTPDVLWICGGDLDEFQAHRASSGSST